MLRIAISIILAAALGGCAVTQSTEDVVLDYNKSFAATRNEMLLLNVLRSAAREPMQFSTMGQVQGTIGNGGQLTIPINNLIGGKNILSPSLQLTDSVNPQVSIIPLASKEFAEGILRPISPETIQLFLHNGWDAEFLLPLVVGSVVCPDGRLIHNSGEYLDGKGTRTVSNAFRNFFHVSAKTFVLAKASSQMAEEYAFSISDKDAMSALKDGLGKGYSITQISDEESGKVVTVAPADSVVEGVDVAGFCESIPGTRPAGLKPDYSDLPGAIKVREAEDVREPEDAHDDGPVDLPGCCTVPGRVVFRSVASILQYLGESHRIRNRASSPDKRGLLYLNSEGEEQVLFRADWGLSTERKAVSVPFHGESYFISAMDLRRDEGTDRSLKTLSFLDQLIALQTNESAIRGAASIFAITQ